MKFSNFAYFGAAALFIGILALPYGYYIFLRWYISLITGYMAYKLSFRQKNAWTISLVSLCILFNPLIPIFLTKATWQIIDVISGIILLSAPKDIANE